MRSVDRAGLPQSLRRVLQAVRLGYRHLTAPWRVLPDLLILGQMRCGTSSLHAYLSGHPQLVPSIYKEVHFFDDGLRPGDDHYQRGGNWYRRHFPLRWHARQRPAFEATPSYLSYAPAALRVRQWLPHATLIVLLRDPVARAVSHHHKHWCSGREKLPFGEAIAAEDSRLAAAAEGLPREWARRYYGYRARGCYATDLRRWFALFPQERFLIMESGRFYADPLAAVNQVCEFLAVPPLPQLADPRPRSQSQGTPTATPAEIAALREWYRPHNTELYHLLGRDLGW
ncbi:MAG: sulfotransferase [Fimbriimonadaceae bacterium]|nr:sulfotransferase [Fimbriimonadaceae bacterium]